MKDKAVKFDGSKLRYDLIPPEAMEALAEVLKYGADKYSDRNWEKEDLTERMFAALNRHLWAWRAGDKVDGGPEGSGRSHLDHVLCCAAMLVTYEKRFDVAKLKWPVESKNGVTY